MLRFVVRRLLLLVPILIGLSILVFVWIRALPGGPAQALLGERADAQSIAEIERQYGLDKPVYVQYWSYLKTVGQGDLGTSVTTRRPVSDELKAALSRHARARARGDDLRRGRGDPARVPRCETLRRSGSTTRASSSRCSASRSRSSSSRSCSSTSSRSKLGLFPTVGRISALINLEHPTNFYLLDAVLAADAEAFWDTLKHMVLPAIALGSIPLAIIARITRAAVLDVQNEDYVRTAHAKGLDPRTVDQRHIFRNALLPITTIIGLQTGLLLSGAVLTETVFAWPGMGTWLVDAIEQRNFPVLQGGILFVAHRLRARQPVRGHHRTR